MLKFQIGDLLIVKRKGLLCTIGNRGSHDSIYLDEGEALLAIELPRSDGWEDWQNIRFVRVATSHYVSLVVSTGATHVYCDNVENGLRDLYPHVMEDVLKVIPR